MTESDRSLARIDTGDLARLVVLAEEAETGLFARRPAGAGRYAGRLLCRALCQGRRDVGNDPLTADLREKAGIAGRRSPRA